MTISDAVILWIMGWLVWACYLAIMEDDYDR